MPHDPSAPFRLRLRAIREEDSRRIHRTALNILAGTGIAVGDDDTRRRLLDLGCREAAGRLTFEDQVVDGRMAFDYRMRPGIAGKGNALRLLQMEGLLDAEDLESP